MFDIYISSLDQSFIWPLLILLGLAVGFIGGLYGVGGFLLTPFLKVVFGLPYPVAVGCSLTIVLINSALTTHGHLKNKRVNIKLAMILALGAVPGTEVGIQINQAMRILSFNGDKSAIDMVLSVFFILLMIFIIATSIIKEKGHVEGLKKDTFFRKFKYGPFINIGTEIEDFISIWGLIVISFLVGITTGMLGIGGGILFFPALTYLFGVSSFVAVGTTAFERVFATAYGSSRYILEGNFNFAIMLFLFIGSFIGVQLGLKTAYHIGDEKLRKTFLFILLSGIFVVLYDIFIIYR